MFNFEVYQDGKRCMAVLHTDSGLTHEVLFTAQSNEVQYFEYLHIDGAAIRSNTNKIGK